MNDHSVQEKDMYPQNAYDRWRELLAEDVRTLFASPAVQTVIKCVGCGHDTTTEVFSVFAIPYRRCAHCYSLFAALRPDQRELDAFYDHALSVMYWRDHVWQPTKEFRERMYVVPLVNWISNIISAYAPHATMFLEYKPKFYSPFFTKHMGDYTAVGPLHCTPPAGSHIVRELSAVTSQPDVAATFDDLDREVISGTFITWAGQHLPKGGLLFFTTNTGSGFEYQILGPYAKRLVPPDRLNLLTIEAIREMLTAAGFSIIDLSTPSVLDVEIVAKTVSENSAITIPNFLQYLFARRDIGTLKSLQTFLQLNNLGSIVRVAAQKV